MLMLFPGIEPGSLIPRPQTSYQSVACYKPGHTAGGGLQASQRSFTYITAAPHCLHYHLSPAFQSVSGSIRIGNTTVNYKCKVSRL